MPLRNAPPYSPRHAAGDANVDNARVDRPAAAPAGKSPGGWFDSSRTPILPTRVTQDFLNELAANIAEVCAAGNVSFATHPETGNKSHRYLRDAIAGMIASLNANWTDDPLWSGEINTNGVYNLASGKTFAGKNMIVAEFRHPYVNDQRRQAAFGIATTNYWEINMENGQHLGDDISSIRRLTDTTFRYSRARFDSPNLVGISGITV